MFRMRSKQGGRVFGTLLACECSPARLVAVEPSCEIAFELRRHPLDNLMETTMQWTTPSYTDMRFGFEITMYIATR
jgi:coenzyme PQQ precursor peptide PqqA